MVLGEQIKSLAQGIQQTFNRLMEGQLENTNYVVIIVSSPGQQTQSCVIVTGERKIKGMSGQHSNACCNQTFSLICCR